MNMVDARVETRWRTHAHVECRRQGERWWLYARPSLEPDARFDEILCGEGAEAAGLGSLCGRGVPADVSLAVRDAYTWRVAGPGEPDASAAVNAVTAREAEQWLAGGGSSRWKGDEAIPRVTDPRWEHATSISTSEVDELLMHFEWIAGEPAPATHVALLDMCRALEDEYLVRVVVWLERRLEHSVVRTQERPGIARQGAAELDLVRARVRRRLTTRRQGAR
jgi:hypothetical protein